jgi:uncharacterized protein
MAGVSGWSRRLMEPDRLDALSVDECLDLLAAHHLGRVAVDDPRGPTVLPVNYTLDRGTIVFRTDEGTKLDAAVRRERISFEVDHVDEGAGTAWSVLVRGKAEEIVDPGELATVRALPLTPFVGGERQRYVRLLSTAISGRRIRLPDGLPAGWFDPSSGR